MFDYTYSEFHNCHDMYMLSLMNKIETMGCPPWIVLCRKAKIPVPEIISNTALSYALGFNTISLYFY